MARFRDFVKVKIFLFYFLFFSFFNLCLPGYTGTFCQTVINYCTSSPCLNGGTCQQTVANNWNCACPVGYSGLRCEIQINYCQSSPCSPNGNCISGMSSYTCQCNIV